MDILSQIITYILAPLFGGIIGWFVGRPKQRVEVKKDELDNVDKAIEIYRKMIQDLETWKGELLAKMEVIEGENQELRKQLRQERKENSNMRARITQLETEIETLKNS
jgi:septal ring factor EnvC (AmiA/AmiB activator)